MDMGCELVYKDIIRVVERALVSTYADLNVRMDHRPDKKEWENTLTIQFNTRQYDPFILESELDLAIACTYNHDDLGWEIEHGEVSLSIDDDPGSEYPHRAEYNTNVRNTRPIS